MKELKLRLLRIALKDNYTEGILINLSDNDKILFDTLEDRVRDSKRGGELKDKVTHRTAIPYTPKGKPYELVVTYSPKFKMPMVLIKDVPQFTGVRMHWGRTANQSSGCPLGGKKSAPGELANTGFTKYMVDLVRKYDKVTLEII